MSKAKHDRQDPPTHQEDPILKLAEVARQLGRSPQTIARWCQDGLLKALPHPDGFGILGVRKSEVNKFLGASALATQVE